jgi:DNA-binding NtrC family response regulator
MAQDIRRLNRWVPIVLIPSNSSEELAIAALRAGVTDYFRQPVVVDELVARVVRCLAEAVPSPFLAPSEATALGTVQPPYLIGESAPMREIDAYIGQVASTDSTVLITGETGTGKELVAALIHMRSPRAEKPFVSINCAAIPETLLESELFGYERGAFTGAHVQKEGALKLANEGTAFFDEIGDMSPEDQAKILRAIESKEIRRLGGKRSIPLDFRVIAATNQDLERRVSEGKFRKDLYFRLNVARISLPPLRDRKEDIPALLGHYIGELNRRLGREVEGLGDDALGPLLLYDWPGNVRELKNLLEAVYVHFRLQWIGFTDLPRQFRRQLGNAGQPQTERDLLLSVLLSTRWNKSQAAQKLHWSRMTLYRKMAKYEIVRENRTDDGTLRISEEAV